LGRILRWYLTKARHPFRDKILGRWWGFFSSLSVWVPYVDELVIRVNANDYIQQKILLEGLYEPELVRWLRDNLKNDDVFWDVGANIGAMTLVASRVCYQVIAFEPEPKAREHLVDHLAVNHCDNVSALHLALSDSKGRAKLSYAPKENSGMHSLCRDHGFGSIDVETIQADELLEEGQIPVPNVMKIDVEGAEMMVFRGAEKLLKNINLRAIVFEATEGANQRPHDVNICSILEKNGFVLSVLGKSDPDTDDDVNNYIALRTY